jgi:hypothetical protein
MDSNIANELYFDYHLTDGEAQSLLPSLKVNGLGSQRVNRRVIVCSRRGRQHRGGGISRYVDSAVVRHVTCVLTSFLSLFYQVYQRQPLSRPSFIKYTNIWNNLAISVESWWQVLWRYWRSWYYQHAPWKI